MTGGGSAAAAAPARLLVRLPNWLGDALMARPLLHALRASLPHANVVAVGPRPLLELMAAERLWDEALPWPLTPAARGSLRAVRPEWAIVLPPSFSSAWFALRSRARRRVGFAGDSRSALLTDAVRRGARGDRHLSREYLELGERVGARASVLPVMPVTDEARAQAGALRRDAGIGERPFAILAPGAIFGPAKRWETERFAALARQLVARGQSVLACGGEQERDACDDVVARAGGAVVSLAGRTSLAAQAALCADADAVVSNDSGLAHLAAAVGAPTVTVFGSTSSAWTAPLGPRVRIVQRPPVCSPCFARTCRIGYRCLTAVSVADVLRAIDELDSPVTGGRGA